MNDEEFTEWLGCLGVAEEWLQAAFEFMDGIEGYTTAGEAAHATALSAIRTVRAAERASRI